MKDEVTVGVMLVSDLVGVIVAAPLAGGVAEIVCVGLTVAVGVIEPAAVRVVVLVILVINGAAATHCG